MSKILRDFLNANENVVGINRRNLELIYPNNPRKHFYIANDKAETKTLLEKAGIPAPKTYAIIERNWEIQEKLKELRQYEEIVIKPSNGSGGNGILLLKRSENEAWLNPNGKIITSENLRMHIASIIYGAYAHDNRDKCIVEQRLNSHPFFENIYKNTLPDLRIIINQHKPLMGMLRIPTKKSGGKANLHQGAMGVGVDLSDGTIQKGYYRQQLTSTHPDSGVKFEGMQIPFWEEIIDISIKTAELVPLKYLGIDIMIDKDRGPQVIEINARPGLQIQNANQLGLGKILRKQNG